MPEGGAQSVYLLRGGVNHFPFSRSFLFGEPFFPKGNEARYPLLQRSSLPSVWRWFNLSERVGLMG
jgi:hypothetical protein